MYFKGKLETFKHHKKDIDRAGKGLECGIGFEHFQDIREGDKIQSIEVITKSQSL